MFGSSKSGRVPKARKAKKKAAKKARPATARTPKRQKTAEELASERRTRAMVIGAVAFVGVGLGATVGLDWLDARAERSLDARRVSVLVEVPVWVPESSRASIESIALDALGAIELEPEDPGPGEGVASELGPSYAVPGSLSITPLRRASMALSESGWFEEAPTVRRVRDGAIEVSGTWRTPAVWVRHGGTDRVADWLGRPMPVELRVEDPDAERSRPLILGVSRGPLRSGATGEPLWNEPWLPDETGPALQLLALLYDRQLEGQVRAIDVSRLGASTELSIVTDRASVIVWGAPPGAWRPEDTRSVEEKLSVLEDHVARTGRIDANERVVEIYGPQTIARDGR